MAGSTALQTKKYINEPLRCELTQQEHFIQSINDLLHLTELSYSLIYGELGDLAIKT